MRRAGFGPRLLYVIGGEYDGDRLDSVEIFDPETNSWTAGVDLPETSVGTGAAAAGLDGKMYLLGGEEAESANVVAFDPQTGAWAEVAPMPTARVFVAVAVVNHRLFAIGGYDGSERCVQDSAG